MNAQKFGVFVAQQRKEAGMTQAELAARLHVTDKAVSRWERGLGFPDINTLEPLADALGISLAELMQAERRAEPVVTVEEASLALADTLAVARLHRKRLLKRLLAGVVALVLAVLVWIGFSGLLHRGDVYLAEYAVLDSEWPGGDLLTIRVGVAGSMGYIRAVQDVSEQPEALVLRFYSAFGGFNSRLGARNAFVLPLAEDCSQIWLEGYREPRLVLEKDAETGLWSRPE